MLATLSNQQPFHIKNLALRTIQRGNYSSELYFKQSLIINFVLFIFTPDTF